MANHEYTAEQQEFIKTRPEFKNVPPEAIDAVIKSSKILEQQKNQRAKAAERAKNNPEAKAKADLRAKRLRVKQTLLAHKAVAAGIVVTEEEISKRIAELAEAA